MKRHVWRPAPAPHSHLYDRCACPGCPAWRRGLGTTVLYREDEKTVWVRETPLCTGGSVAKPKHKRVPDRGDEL
jgi:hypothetical protein